MRDKGMILKKKIKPIETTKKSEKNTDRGKRLAPDVYLPMFEPKRFLIRETPNKTGGFNKTFLEMAVKRFDDDEAMPNVFINMYMESERYTGYLKGKSVYFPLEMLYDVLENLEEVSRECDKRKIK
jgi:hypothetical protein